MRLTGHQPLEYAEAALIVIGVAVCIATVFSIVRRRAYREAVTLDPCPTASFTAIDLLSYFVLTNVVGMLCVARLAPPAATTVPAASQPDQLIAQAPATAAASFLVPASGAILLLALIPLRVSGGFRGWGLESHSWPRAALPGLLRYLAIWPICAGALVLTRAIVYRFAPDPHFDEHATLNLLRAARDGPAWVSTCLILGAVIAAPLAEELLFRGVILSMLQRLSGSAWIAVLGSSAIFALFHWSNADTVPPMLVFGVALGVAYSRSRMLAVPIIMHVCFNGKTILWLLLGAPS